MKLTSRILASGLAAAFLVPAIASAQETRVIVRDEPNQILEVGAGVGGFTAGLDDETDAGAAWDVRAIFGARSPIGFEVAYVGGLNDLQPGDSETPGEALQDPSLLTNAGEALVRLNLTQSDFQPFLAAGVGIHDFRVVDVEDMDRVDAENFRDSTDIAVPAAAGVQAYLGRMTLGARVSYRYIFDNQVQADADAADIQSWAATGRLGLTF